MITKEGSTKIVNIMIPGAGVLFLGRGHISHIVKLHYFFKNLLIYLGGGGGGGLEKKKKKKKMY